MRRVGLVVIIITMVSKILGLFRDIILSYFYGVGIVSDAYLLATTITTVFFTLLISAISTALIPVFRKIEKANGLERSYSFTNNLISIYVVGSIIFSFIIFVFAEPITRLFGMGLSREGFELTVLFTRISIFSVIFLGVVNIYTSILQINEKFFTPALLGFPLNIVTILIIYLSYPNNEYLLPLGILISSIIQFLFLLPSLSKMNYSYNFKIDFKDSYIKDMGFIAVPLLIGMSVNQINIIVDRSMATSIAVGGVSALNYSNKLIGFIQGVFIYSIVSIIFPYISKLAVNQKFDKLKGILNISIFYIAFLTIPVTIGIIFYSTEITELVFGRGAFNENAINLTSSSLLFYSVGLIGIGLRELLTRTFLSLHDSKTPMINAIIAVGINIILNIYLSKHLGIGGLALASSISAIITTILLLYCLQKKIPNIVQKEVYLKILSICFLSYLLVLSSKYLYSYMTSFISSQISLLIILMILPLCYILLSIVLRIISLKQIMKLKNGGEKL